MKQTEKLASAMYLVKSAGMQEKLQDAVRYVKHIFNPPTDEEVWASRFKAKPGDIKLEPKHYAQIHGGQILGGLGGLLLGAGAGKMTGGKLLKNTVKKYYLRKLKNKSRLNASNILLREANDPDFAKEMNTALERHGVNAGKFLGGLGGGLAGQLAGGYSGLQQVKPDLIEQLRDKGYPKN